MPAWAIDIEISFSKKRIDTLKPYDWKKKSPIHSYATSIVKIRGYSNDTIKFGGIWDLTLSGKIDTIVKMDYYGTHNIICVFSPYRATKGDLEIEYSLY